MEDDTIHTFCRNIQNAIVVFNIDTVYKLMFCIIYLHSGKQKIMLMNNEPTKPMAFC